MKRFDADQINHILRKSHHQQQAGFFFGNSARLQVEHCILIKLSDRIPAEAKAKVDEIKGKMKDGSFDVFTGPVVDGTGKERLAAGTRADDDWMGKIDFFVKGVEGQVPASK